MMDEMIRSDDIYVTVQLTITIPLSSRIHHLGRLNCNIYDTALKKDTLIKCPGYGKIFEMRGEILEEDRQTQAFGQVPETNCKEYVDQRIFTILFYCGNITDCRNHRLPDHNEAMDDSGEGSGR
ncbi:MAG: hypothetical protein H6Q59_353 [Firmicutes bacterium]|nr:hypothetical protein [Bacillota bacterium]